MTTKTRASISYSIATTTNVDFGFCDDRGRALGVCIAIGTRTATADANGWCHLAEDDMGLKYRSNVHATRDGKTFGALQRDTLHDTREEAEAAARKRMEGTRARYAKKFA